MEIVDEFIECEALQAGETITEEQLPLVIAEQFKDADLIKKQILAAQEKAEEAKRKSEELHKVGKFGGGKKLAIEDLQETTTMIASAHEQSVVTQELLFQYQGKLAKATKWLFELGVNNTANTESIIRQLETYMSGESENELDEMKQNEIQSVIDRLLEQESIQRKQEKMWDQIDFIDSGLNEQQQINIQQETEIQAQAQKDVEHDNAIEELQEKVQMLMDENAKIGRELNSKNGKVITYVALVVALVALAMSVVQFFI